MFCGEHNNILSALGSHLLDESHDASRLALVTRTGNCNSPTYQDTGNEAFKWALFYTILVPVVKPCESEHTDPLKGITPEII